MLVGIASQRRERCNSGVKTPSAARIGTVEPQLWCAHLKVGRKQPCSRFSFSGETPSGKVSGATSARTLRRSVGYCGGRARGGKWRQRLFGYSDKLPRYRRLRRRAPGYSGLRQRQAPHAYRRGRIETAGGLVTSRAAFAVRTRCQDWTVLLLPLLGGGSSLAMTYGRCLRHM